MPPKRKSSLSEEGREEDFPTSTPREKSAHFDQHGMVEVKSKEGKNRMKKERGTAKAKVGMAGKKVSTRKGPSGYIVFAAEYRKEVQAKNQDMSFGGISKIVGHKWQTLDKPEKEQYAAKAKTIEEQKAKQL